MFDYLPGLGWDPVWEQDLELHQQVAPLRGGPGQWQALPPQAPHRARLYDVNAGQRHHAVVQRWHVDRASAESLEERRK